MLIGVRHQQNSRDNGKILTLLLSGAEIFEKTLLGRD